MDFDFSTYTKKHNLQRFVAKITVKFEYDQTTVFNEVIYAKTKEDAEKILQQMVDTDVPIQKGEKPPVITFKVFPSSLTNNLIKGHKEFSRLAEGMTMSFYGLEDE